MERLEIDGVRGPEKQTSCPFLVSDKLAAEHPPAASGAGASKTEEEDAPSGS